MFAIIGLVMMLTWWPSGQGWCPGIRNEALSQEVVGPIPAAGNNKKVLYPGRQPMLRLERNDILIFIYLFIGYSIPPVIRHKGDNGGGRGGRRRRNRRRVYEGMRVRRGGRGTVCCE